MEFWCFFTFGEFVVTLLKILTRTRKRVISRDIRPAISLIMMLMLFIIIIMTVMKVRIVMTTMSEVTWYNVRGYEEGDP